MKFNAVAAAVSAAFLAGNVHAEEAVAEEAASALPEVPTFTVRDPDDVELQLSHWGAILDKDNEPLNTNLMDIAYQPEGPLPRTVHR